MCDSKQEWHFSDNTQNVHTHTPALSLTHTLSLSPVLYSSQTCQQLDPLHKKNQTMYGINSNKHSRGHYRYDGSDRRKLDMLHLLLTRLWPVMLSTTHVTQFVDKPVDKPSIRLCARVFLHCGRHLRTSFLYDLAFPRLMNLLWVWRCGFLCRRLEYKYGCYA